MNYKLAEQLKEAGFPQDTRHFFGFIEAHKDWELDNGDMSDSVACPTFSELIEECGNKFYWITRRREKEWYAVGDDGKKSHGTVRGNSPEEAVAKLWLKLHA